jgi:glycogen(starch) synthase
VRDWRPDVVHLHTHWAWYVARAIREQTNASLVYTVHSVDRAEYEFGEEGQNVLDRCDDQEASLAAADRVIALTHCESELLSHYYPWIQNDVRVIGNGIDDSKILNSSKIYDNKDRVLVLYSGRLVDRKGIPELLACIPIVLAQAPETRFVFAGGPAHCSAADVERHWVTPELDPFRKQIHFTGWLSPSELAKWYRNVDVLVVPSRYEPFGMVVLEGMLHGLPIIAADVGGPREILDHERTGLLFPPKNVEALAKALLRLIGSPALRKRMGTAAGQEVRQKWLWRYSVRKMQDVYLEALESSRTRQMSSISNQSAIVGLSRVSTSQTLRT